LLNASAYYLNPAQMLKDIGSMIKEGFTGQLKDNELYKRYKRKLMDTPLSATKEFRKLVKTLKPALTDIQAPTLIVQGELDGLIPPKKSAEFLYATIGASNKRICYFRDSKHMICLDVEKDQLIEEVYRFLMNE
jgi:carboxylesterase